MKRIAILVEPHVMDRHVGVRNYLFSVRRLLARRAKVDFVSFFRSDSSRVQWFRITLTDEQFAVDNGTHADLVYRGTPGEVYRQWKANQTQPDAPAEAPVAYTHFGSDLRREGYDACIISAPWVLRSEDRLPIAKQYGLVYDTIPNHYVLTNQNKPWAFATEHLQGFAYFRRHCEATFGISGRTRDDLIEYFDFDPAATFALPPMIPNAYFDPTTPTVTRDNSLVLASPLDRRKGLDVLPKMMNGMADQFRRVFMYGGVRCSPDELKQFFSTLDPTIRIRWYARARAKTVKKLFARSRLLLFPSYEEGLGLPLIEAQMCGCRVAARSIEPMKSLMLPGSIPVASDSTVDGDAVARVLGGGDDHAQIRERAFERFHPDHVAGVLFGAMDATPKLARLSA